jgi:hypothetical protein
MKRRVMAGILLAGLTITVDLARAESVAPMPDDQCRNLAALMGEELGIEPTLTMETFKGSPEIKGRSCHLAWAGSGLNHSDQTEVVDRFFARFLDWQPDFLLSTTDAKTEVQGFRKDNQLIVMSARWDAPNGACNPGEAVGSCQLSPEQRLWTIEIDAMMSQP